MNTVNCFGLIVALILIAMAGAVIGVYSGYVLGQESVACRPTYHTGYNI